MDKITTIGLDLAKHVFHVVYTDRRRQVVSQRMLKRSRVLPYFANLAGSLVGMEACASVHYWARELSALGHLVKLIPPQYRWTSWPVWRRWCTRPRVNLTRYHGVFAPNSPWHGAIASVRSD